MTNVPLKCTFISLYRKKTPIMANLPLENILLGLEP